MSQTDLSDFFKMILNEELVSATLSSPFLKSDHSILKISLRAILLKGQLTYQVSEHGSQKVFHRNFSPKESVQYIKNALQDYKQGVFTLKDSHYHILVNKQGIPTVIKKEIKAVSCPISHNRKKNYILHEGMKVPFLIDLGVMTNEGKVVAKKYDKFRQINRFLEMVKDIVEKLPKDRCIEIVDFGCGKAYLTFALHYYLHDIEKRSVRIRGLDLKQDVVLQCNQLAERLHLSGLSFAVGDINDFNCGCDVDLMISLHACDTATDAAFIKAIEWNAKVILSVPCCQHELYSQIHSNRLETLLRHGILRERMAALATDAARADLLTILGYEVQILEFIDMEHTPKNLLIRAIKGVSEEKQKQAKERYELFKKELNISPFLERAILNMNGSHVQS